MKLQELAVLTLMSWTGLVGDILLKMAAAGGPIRYAWYGALVYGLSASGWYYVLKTCPLTTVCILYPVIQCLSAPVLGHFLFNEVLTWRHVVGGTIGLIAVFIMSGE